jgi:hypothetical protein
MGPERTSQMQAAAQVAVEADGAALVVYPHNLASQEQLLSQLHHGLVMCVRQLDLYDLLLAITSQ